MPIIRSGFGAVLLEGAHASPRIGVDHQIHSGERGQCENKVRLPLRIDAC